VRDAAGKFLFAVRVFQDVTEAREWSQALAENEQRLAATYESAAIAISEIDGLGNLLRVNETACAITGYPREELLGLNVFDLTHPEDQTVDQSSFADQVASSTSYVVEKRLRRKDGRWISVSVASSTVRDSGGRFLYGIRVMQDITARKRAEEMVRESESRLRQVLEALPTAVYTTDAIGRVNFFNQAAVDLSGRVPIPDSDEWCVTWRLYRADGSYLPPDQCPMAVALRENRAIRGEELIAERPDGTRAVIVPHPTPLHDASGELIGAVNMLLDITERKRAEERQKALIDELNHRVKNTLATVQSLAAQTLRGAGVAAQARDAFGARLFALSRTHDQLSRAGWESADFKSILDDVFAPYRTESSERVLLEGRPTRLAPQRALLLAMVMHELATNAVKYGALSVPAGKLRVAWHVTNTDGGQKLLIDWEESGGPPVKPPQRRGFGSRLAERAIEQELGGSARIEFAPSGVRCHFEIPLIILHS
jgi:PAS domain S-box-containing protein